MFLHEFPYSTNQELNLDWVIKQIRILSHAKNILFDDTLAMLGASNVQEAIEKLKEVVDIYTQQLSGVAIIDSDLPDIIFIGGYTFSHLQTVNNVTLTSIIDAVRLNRYIVLKRHYGDDTSYFVCTEISEDILNLKHTIILLDPLNLVTSEVDIYGLNDQANVYVDVIADINQTRVNSFNTRTGDITSEAGDYEASQVTYDDAGTSLGATDVQGAIEALKTLIPVAYVASFNGRGGAVSPSAGDYDASQIDYDNSQSGLTATDAQSAIDEIVNLVLAAGVASFNGRTGAVNPQAGDYDANLIGVDTSTNSLPATITNMQEYLDYMHPLSVTVTLTINGAKEDSITIYDSTDTQVGNCIFASGQTQGTCQIDVPVGGGTYKFRSSVAKVKSGGSFVDYEDSITLSDTPAQSVNLYPDKAIYWYGNFIKAFASGTWTGQTVIDPTLNTNSFNFTHNGVGYYHSLYISDALDFTGYTSIKVILEGSCNESTGNSISLFTGTDLSDLTQTLYSLNSYNDMLNEITLTQPNSNGRLGIKLQIDPPNTCNLTFHAIYGE